MAHCAKLWGGIQWTVGISTVREKHSGGNRLETDETNCNSTEGNSAIIFGGSRQTTTGLAKKGVPVLSQ